MLTKDDYVLFLDKRTQDKSVASISDQTIYGSPNQDRNTEAHYLLVAKMNENQELTWISNIDNTNPLTTLSWSHTNSVDGAYRYIMFVVPIWLISDHYDQGTKDSSGNYLTYPNIVYNSTLEKYYVAISDDFVGIEPGVTSGWETYWSEIADFTLHIFNTRIIVVIHDDVIDFRFDECLVTELDETADYVLIGCDELDKLLPTLKMSLLLNAARSNNWQQKQTRSEIILSQAIKKFCC